ncbi:hypothetical protein GCM10022243_52900 [Saccharothrix violaceirubra]|uniref:Cell wall synthesis protein Wag31 n=1 Tax=Saccharothrix violaceirubra TaxID=413306 RepID=A0A7W7SYL9_9PSEU|nr:DivIVA domain-containing protein [Saccharothrix violaceirubra]MBB4963352.1 cell division septum initiation protein DivIVA [Saccharothrix violaceirubra]
MDSEAVDDAAPRFTTAMRGYDRRQVDEYVAAQAAALADASLELARLRSTGPAPTTPASHLGERVAGIVAFAEHQAEELVAEATRTAETLRGDAKRQAELILREAEVQAGELRRGAERDAEQTAADLRSRKLKAATEAERVEAEARRRADEVLGDAVSRLRFLVETQNSVVEGLRNVVELVGVARVAAEELPDLAPDLLADPVHAG